jgi:hypothetical protein
MLLRGHEAVGVRALAVSLYVGDLRLGLFVLLDSPFCLGRLVSNNSERFGSIQ